MSTHLAFLRAINLGAKRKFPKEAIRASTEAAGFVDVETHINTGNIRFGTTMRSRARIEAKLEAAFLADRGFDVPTIAFSAEEFARIGADADDLGHDGLERHYVYLMRDELSADVVERVQELSCDGNDVVVRGRAVHVLLGPGYQDGTVDVLKVERHLGVVTNRNANVVRTLTQKWC